MAAIDENKRVIDLTVAEFRQLLQETRNVSLPPVVVDTTKRRSPYVYGISGIAQLFGCSMTQANRIKRSGKIDAAITQVGRMIITDAEKALALAGKKDKRTFKK